MLTILLLQHGVHKAEINVFFQSAKNMFLRNDRIV